MWTAVDWNTIIGGNGGDGVTGLAADFPVGLD